ncbi:Ig-like domain-containing protein [Pontibacter mangrovi]|uniref:T9SS type B sorting domain-containing protein n=1 Tax=Pontibacter mangrovi TaxID=2589816 RepID=A0A501WC38_9BACT|nr:Ig-like domain-containing protein [Pontibacter mangrovi]TPE43066.1 T9SS type B sorting domain-containing protein [Pontibacter mangrovi]
MPLYIYARRFTVFVLIWLCVTGVCTSPTASAAAPPATAALAAPSLSAKTSLVGAISLKWTAVSGATGYVVEKSVTGTAGTFVVLKSLGAGTTTYRDTELYYNQKAYYRVKATGSGDTPYSNVASATTYPENHVFRIMPLGDSNTEGGSSDIPINDKAAYRDKLEQELQASNIEFDYIGSESSGSNYVQDVNHAGFGGARNRDLVEILQNGYYYRWYDNERFGLDQQVNYLDYFKPDIILLHTGTNEISNDGVDNSQSTTDEMEEILDEIEKYEQRSGKEVLVIVAKIIKTVCTATDCYRGPVYTKNDIIDKYNAQVEALVKNRISQGDALELVDMADANIIYEFASNGGDMADRLHPTHEGYGKMAPVWFKVLNRYLNRQLTPIDTQAPETTIASQPDKLSNEVPAKFSFSSNEAGVTYQVSMDGGAFATAANPYSINGLNDGEHTLQVRAIDQAGNMDATPASYTWVQDTKAPGAPVVQAPAGGAILNENKPAISGTAEAATTVSVFAGNTRIGTATAGSDGTWRLTPASALAEGEQRITAKAADEVGNVSAASAVRTFTVDTKAPETTIAAGPDAISNTAEPEFTFSSNEDNVSYEVSLDGGAYAAIAGNKYTANSLSDGEHTLEVRATDAGGNTDASPAAFTWTLDTKAPEAPVVASVSEDRGPASDDQITADNTIKLSGQAEAGTMVAVLLQGEPLGEVQANASGNWAYSHEQTALAAGTYTFTATATDAAGNESAASKAFTVTVELTAPEAEIATTAGATANGSFPITITFSEDVYTLVENDLSLQNASLENFSATDKATYTANVVPSADGEVRISLAKGKVTDLAGNPNEASNLLQLTYDATAPAGYMVAFDTERVDVNNQHEVDLGVREAEVGATYFYSISSSNGGEAVEGSATVPAKTFAVQDLDLTGLSDGLLTVRLYLVDEAGNKGEEVTAQVEKITKDIVAVANPSDFSVKFRTTFDALELPDQVEVSYSNGEKETINVVWQPGDYKGEVPGDYLVIGQLELKENTSNTQNMRASVTVTVEPNQPPSALTLSDDKFQPDIEPEEVIGTFATTDPDDDTFTYEFEQGEGDQDNQLFELYGNELHLISNKGLSGKSVFTVRVRTTDPYNNSFSRSFRLTKSLYEPDGGIKLVNAFSPDGDGINDTWVVPELRYYNNTTVQVFDRAGKLLFQTTNPEEGWDGRGKDGRVQAGSYFYIIQIKDIKLVEKGVITVLK